MPAREARAFAAVAWSAFVLASVRGPFVAAGLGSGGWFGCVRRVPFSAQHVIIRNGGRLNAGAAGEAELRKLGLADAPPAGGAALVRRMSPQRVPETRSLFT